MFLGRFVSLVTFRVRVKKDTCVIILIVDLLEEPILSTSALTFLVFSGRLVLRMLKLILFENTDHRLSIFAKNSCVNSTHVSSKLTSNLNAFVNTVCIGRFKLLEVTRG